MGFSKLFRKNVYKEEVTYIIYENVSQYPINLLSNLLVKRCIEAAILCFVYRTYKMRNYIQSLSEIVNHSSLTHDKNVEEKLAHEMSYQFNFYLSSTFWMHLSLPFTRIEWRHICHQENLPNDIAFLILSEKFENVLSRAIRIWITVRKFLWPVLSANRQTK